MTSRIHYNNPDQGGLFGLPYHYELLSDERRVQPFAEAIQKTCSGKRVFESGSGSGIFSILAARSGATEVYAAEIDPTLRKIAQANIERLGLQQIIVLLAKDTRSVTLADLDSEKVDVAIAEHLSTWQVTEPQISVLNYINQFLIKPDGIRIPELIHNNLELAQSVYRFDHTELRTHYFEFTGVRKPVILSAPQTMYAVDLSQENSMSMEGIILVPVTRQGIVNSIRLTSPLKIQGDIHFDGSDSLMPPVVIPLPNDQMVVPGDTVAIRIRYHFETRWEDVYLDATIIH